MAKYNTHAQKSVFRKYRLPQNAKSRQSANFNSRQSFVPRVISVQPLYYLTFFLDPHNSRFLKEKRKEHFIVVAPRSR